MMLIDEMIRGSYTKQLKEMNDDQGAIVAGELMDLLQWSEKWSMEVNDPVCKNHMVPFFYKTDSGKIEERFFDIKYWPGIEENRKILKQTDERIVVACRKIKRAGFSRPTSFLAESFFKYIYSDDTRGFFDSCPREWASARYLYCRIWDTARIVYRFIHDEFSKRTEHKDDGTINFYYGKEQWYNEMVYRGLAPKRRT